MFEIFFDELDILKENLNPEGIWMRVLVSNEDEV